MKGRLVLLDVREVIVDECARVGGAELEAALGNALSEQLAGLPTRVAAAAAHAGGRGVARAVARRSESTDRRRHPA